MKLLENVPGIVFHDYLSKREPKVRSTTALTEVMHGHGLCILLAEVETGIQVGSDLLPGDVHVAEQLEPGEFTGK